MRAAPGTELATAPIRPAERARAFRKLATLLKPGGLLLLSIRNASDDPSRPMWDCSAGEIEGLARDHGLTVVRIAAGDDRLGRGDVHWTTVSMRLADDGSGAFGGTPAAVKVVVRLTRANERAVKSWFHAKNGPSGENLVTLLRHSDEVLESVLLLAGRHDLIVARKLTAAREKLALIDDLQP